MHGSFYDQILRQLRMLRMEARGTMPAQHSLMPMDTARCHKEEKSLLASTMPPAP